MEYRIDGHCFAGLEECPDRRFYRKGRVRFSDRQFDLPSRIEDRRNPCTGTGRSQPLESSVDLWTQTFVEILLKQNEKKTMERLIYCI